MTLTIFGAAALAAWIYLLLAHGRFWRADQRLSGEPAARAAWPGVAVVIPARNEAEVIGETLASHFASDYPGALTVILVDDHSHDGTAEVARAAANAAQLGDARAFRITQAPPLPAGWTGKVWAMAHGLSLADARAADARYTLFTDADIRHGPDTLRRLVDKAEGEGRALVSLMALLDSRGPWASLLIPAFVYFFQMLYPFARSNAPRRRTAAAAGGCMLVDRAALRAAGDLAPIRDALIDDCALARLLKGAPPSRAIWLGLTTTVTSARDNRSLGSIWSMVARTAFTQLNYSAGLLAFCLLGLGFVFLLGPALALAAPLHGDPAAATLGGAAWIAMAASFVPTLRLYGRPAALGVLLPLAAALYMGMTVTSAWRHWRGRGGQWKGRAYALGANTRNSR